MKTKKLMVGDLVYHEGKIKQVDVVWYDRYVSLTDLSKNWGSIYADKYPIEEIEPIPLTLEILKKNGFEKKSIGNAPLYTFSDDDEYYALVIDEYTDSLWRIEYTNCEMNFPFVRIMVCFVHELQHALILNGIDKKIVL